MEGTVQTLPNQVPEPVLGSQAAQTAKPVTANEGIHNSAPPQQTPQKEVAAANTAAARGTGVPGAENASKAFDSLDPDYLRYLDLKAETLTDMVHHVEVSRLDAVASLKFLYLTNLQAQKITSDKMQNVQHELGIHSPKMVIRLMPSRFGRTHWDMYPYAGGRFPMKRTPEKTEEDRLETERQLMLLAKNVLLPLAIKNNAVIIGNDGCSLIAAFIRVSSAWQRQYKAACPFTIVMFARAPYFAIKAQKDTKSMAYSLREKCDVWAKETGFEDCLRKRFGSDVCFWPESDLPPGQFSLVMFECLTPSKDLTEDSARLFQDRMVSSLGADLPVVALLTYGSERLDLLPMMSDHVRGNFPLVLIDSRKCRVNHRPKNIKDIKEVLNSYMKELQNVGDDHGGPVIDWYSTSMLAFVKQAVNRSLLAHAQSAMQSAQKQKDAWIYEAIVDATTKMREEQKKKATGGMECDGNDLISYTDVVMEYVGESLWLECEKLGERAEKAIEALDAAQTYAELRKSLEDQWCAIRGSCLFDVQKELNEFVRGKNWCEVKANKNKCTKGIWQLVITPGEEGEFPALETAKDALKGLLKTSLDKSNGFNRKFKSKEAFCKRDDLWLAVHEVLESESVYSCNLHDMKALQDKLEELTAQDDRLPRENRLQTLLLLRRAWTLTDLYNSHAWYYKWSAKIAYLLQLILVFCTVTVTVIGVLYRSLMSNALQRGILMGLALGSSLGAGAVTIVDPGQKWLQLRSGAMTLTAEIWKFRTRVGEYSSVGLAFNKYGAEIQAEQRFSRNMAMVQEKVQQSAGLKKTSFYAQCTSTTSIEDMTVEQCGQDDDVVLDLSSPRSRRPSFSERMLGSKELKRAQDVARKYNRHGQFWAGHHASKPQEILDRFQKLANEKLDQVSDFLDMESSPDLEENHLEQQRMSNKPVGEFNNHQSPLKPNEYVKWRLIPTMHWYQERIPLYSRRRLWGKFIVLLAMITNTIISAFWEPSVTAVIAAFAAAFAAWQEFVGVDKKLERYSSVASALESHLLWWQTLSDVDQSIMSNIDNLVEVTETLVDSELAAWLSDAQQALKQMAKSEGQQPQGGSTGQQGTGGQQGGDKAGKQA